MIADFLNRVQTRMEQVLPTGNPDIDSMLVQPMRRTGKGIRPRLVLFSAGLFGPISDKVIDVAVAAECIHTASLIHDDILDDASVRRGVPSAGSLFGAKAAVLIGDHYFSTAYQCLGELGLPEIVLAFSKAIRSMCLGEISQDLHLFDADMDQALYYRHIYGKTASLFGASARCGALAAGASPHQAESLARFGEAFGLAYQICDDVCDVAGTESELGKPVGGDLKNGVMTLPVIKGIHSAEDGPWLREMFRSGFVSESALGRSLACLSKSGAVTAAARESLLHLDQGFQELEPFRNLPGYAELRTFAENLVRLPERLGMITAEELIVCGEPIMAVSCPAT